MKRYRLTDLIPPWAAPRKHLALCLGGLGAAALLSLCLFLSQFSLARKLLYTGVPGKSPLEPGAQMAYFADLIGAHGYVTNVFSQPVFFPFLLLALGAACLALVNFSGFRSGTRSSYLMRRLPDRWEYPRRCLAIPVLTVLLSLVLLPVLTGLFYAIYVRFTPAQCLRPDQWPQLRAHVIHLFLPILNRGWG